MLLQAVREVAEFADPVDGAGISTRGWDDARALSARFADAPPARRIAEHLGLPWAKVRELAFMPPRGRHIGLGHALNERQGNWLTEEYSDFILALIARRLAVRTLTPGQYRAERVSMLATDRGRHTHGGQLRLPTEEQIAALAGTWDRALAHAGLRARAGLGGHRARVGPAAIIDVLDRCYEHQGTEPNSNEIEDFARANGIPYPRRERGKPWSAHVSEWKDRRRARGLAVPDGPPPKTQRPDYSVDVGAGVSGERRSKDAWDDLDEVVDWVARYLRQLQRGQRSGQRAYDDWARRQDGAPWSAAFNRHGHGGWVAVRRAAQQRLAHRQRLSRSGSPPPPGAAARAGTGCGPGR